MDVKKNAVILFAILCCLCRVAVSFEANKNVAEEHIREVSVMVGKDVILLLFVEKNMPLIFKETIAADLKTVLSHLGQARFEQLEKLRMISCRNKELKLTHRLVKVTKSSPVPYDVFPELLKSGHFGGAVKTNGTYCLVIDHKVINEYKTAIT